MQTRLGKNIQKRIAATGKTQEQICNEVGFSTVALHKLISGKSKSTKKLVELARALQCDAEALQYGSVDGLSDNRLGQPDNFKQIDTEGKIPLISWTTAGKLCESSDPFEPGDADDWMINPFPNVGEGAFCLRIDGDSMEPEYLDGEIIIVDPTISARHNDDVVVRTPDGKSTFKRIQITHEGSYLIALNQDHPNRKIVVPEGTVICGVVVGSWKIRRK